MISIVYTIRGAGIVDFRDTWTRLISLDLEFDPNSNITQYWPVHRYYAALAVAIFVSNYSPGHRNFDSLLDRSLLEREIRSSC